MNRMHLEVVKLSEPRPVLGVVADQARGRLPDNAGHRLRMSQPYTAGIVHVPYVEAPAALFAALRRFL